MNKKIIFLLSLFVFILTGCKDNNPVIDYSPCGGTVNGIVPRAPYNSPIWHPNGNFIGFNHTPLVSISYPYGEECQGQQHFNPDSTGFWLINPDGSNMRRILPYTLLDPSWSPDGKWIAFVSGAQIYKMRFTGTTFDTTTIVQLTTEGRNFFPSWSSDGQWIAYDSNSNDQNGANVIWIMLNDGSEKKDISEHGLGEWRMPNWSPNSKQIVHQRYIGIDQPEIFIMNNTGKNPVRLTYNNRFDGYPKFSNDGSKIAFLSNSNLWIMDSTGNNLRELTPESVHTTSGVPFSWSPDGSSIVYTKYSANDWTYDNGILWILNTQTGEKKQLTFNSRPK